jgi:integrase
MEVSMAIREYTQDGKKYYEVYVNARGKNLKRVRVQRSVSGIETLSTAQREEKRLVKEVTEAIAKFEGRGLTWFEVLYRWEIAQRNSSNFTKHRYCTTRDHLARIERYTKLWKDRPASEITRADGRQVIGLCQSQGVSIALLKRIKNSINTVYTWGLEEGLIQHIYLSGKSPVHGLEVGKKEERVPPILTLEEVRKLLLEAKLRNHPWYPIWAFAICTGMRSGELQALEWGDIDEKNGIIRVSKSYNRKIEDLKCPKNGQWRNVDINPQLWDIINALRVERGSQRFILPEFAEWKYGYAGKVLREFLSQIGIQKDVTFHTLRACFATHLLSTGVEAMKVMRMGGWNDLKTFQIYLRMSGVDVKGIAGSLVVIPSRDVTKNVIPLFS